MTLTSSIYQQLKFALAASWTLINLAINPLGLRAQSAIINQSPLDYDPPDGGRAPDGRDDIGGRPGCPEVKAPLTALVPKYYIGLTVADRPTFWVFIPYSSVSQQSAQLVLWDESEAKFYETTFPIANTPGIASFSLPNDAPQLAVGKTYRWDFSFRCTETSSVAFAQGWVKRVELSDELKNQLETATPRERVALYAAKSLWQEALNELAQMRRSKPEDEAIKTDWEDLLGDRDVRLEAIAKETLVDCCTPNK